jgi:hypothetical protein
MESITRLLTILAVVVWGWTPAVYAQNCHHVDVRGDQPFGPTADPHPGACNTHLRNGFPVPDPSCTPGAFNPTVTVNVIDDPAFSTKCIRDQATTPREKSVTYSWYRLRPPVNNDGQNQVCELDHLVPLELGGADTLDNIWPQCGPNGVGLRKRDFKLKDMVEDYLTAMVKAGKMDLDEARKGIAADWTQYLDAANRTCRGDRCWV